VFSDSTSAVAILQASVIILGAKFSEDSRCSLFEPLSQDWLVHTALRKTYVEKKFRRLRTRPSAELDLSVTLDQASVRVHSTIEHQSNRRICCIRSLNLLYFHSHELEMLDHKLVTLSRWRLLPYDQACSSPFYPSHQACADLVCLCCDHQLKYLLIDDNGHRLPHSRG
jgi:hypothetical protein